MLGAHVSRVDPFAPTYMSHGSIVMLCLLGLFLFVASGYIAGRLLCDCSLPAQLGAGAATLDQG